MNPGTDKAFRIRNEFNGIFRAGVHACTATAAQGNQLVQCVWSQWRIHKNMMKGRLRGWSGDIPDLEFDGTDLEFDVVFYRDSQVPFSDGPALEFQAIGKFAYFGKIRNILIESRE